MFEGLKRVARDKLMRAVREAVLPEVDAAVRGLGEDLRVTEQRLADYLQVTEQRLGDDLRGVEARSRRDLFAAADREAVRSSAEYVGRAMAAAEARPGRTAVLEHAVASAPTGGLALEFGVWSGDTLRIIAAGRPGDVYGFDSFDGLPEHWRPGFPAGTFGGVEPPDVDGAELVVGLFDAVLPNFMRDHDGPVDLLHVDCDLYSSTVTVLEHVGPRLRPGSMVVFDEYFNHQNWRDGEFRAWAEFVERTGLTYSYVSYSFDDEQVSVRVESI